MKQATTSIAERIRRKGKVLSDNEMQDIETAKPAKKARIASDGSKNSKKEYKENNWEYKIIAIQIVCLIYAYFYSIYYTS